MPGARVSGLALIVGVSFVWFVPSSSFCRADVTREEVADSMMIVRMTIDPAPSPEPALKYRLLPAHHEQRPGNAVPYYHRAFAEMQRLHHGLRQQYGADYQRWAYVPDDEFPAEAVRHAMQRFDAIVERYLSEPSRRASVDWGFEEELLQGDETIAFRLPEMEQARDAGRMLSVSARLAIAEGRLEDAIYALQLALQMARDVSVCKFMVCDMVAIAIADSMLSPRLEEFIASEGSPNLYWALAALPDPLILGRDSLELELDLGFRMFPWLRDVENAEHAPDEWRRLYTETLAEVESNFGEAPLFRWAADADGEVPDHVREVLEQGMATLYALKLYPAAKDALVAGGMPAEQVERMPVAKALSVQTARAYRYIADEMEKLWHVPYPDARKMEGRERELLRGKFEGGEGGKTLEPIPLAASLLPATTSYRRAYVRLQRQLAALVVIEALRMHAAQTGRLPDALTDVSIVPVPDNPATGEPFEYHLDGDTAILMLPPEDGFYAGKQYEIKLRPSS